MQVVRDADSVETSAIGPRPAGFWRRLAAFVIDLLVLGVACYAIGQMLGSRAYALGDWGRLIGLVVGTLYLGTLHSAHGGGRTLGKSALGLRVRASDGALLSTRQAYLRAAVYMLPATFNGWYFDISPFTDALPTMVGYAVVAVMGVFVFVVVFGGVLSSAVLFLSDSPWRRALHDALAGSVVVREGGEGRPDAPPFTRTQRWAAGIAPFVVVGALCSVFAYLTYKDDSIEDALVRLSEVQRDAASVYPGSKAGVKLDSTSHALLVEVWVPDGSIDGMAASQAVARTIAERHPDLLGSGQVRVLVASGYTLLFYSEFQRHQFILDRPPG